MRKVEIAKYPEEQKIIKKGSKTAMALNEENNNFLAIHPNAFTPSIQRVRQSLQCLLDPQISLGPKRVLMCWRRI